MKNFNIFTFIFILWILIIIGGGLIILITSKIDIIGSLKIGSEELTYSSIAKASIAITLVIVWIFILDKIKNWVFHKQIKN